MKTIAHVRLNDDQYLKLREIAEQNHNTPSGVIRVAIDALLDFVRLNGGRIPLANSIPTDLRNGTPRV